MPLHRLYHAPGVFSATDKEEIAERITKIYTGVGLPAFYVNVIFVEVPVESLLIGGKPAPKFVRVVSQHLARTMPTYERKQYCVNQLEEAFGPYVKARGLDWEIHIEEHERDTWRTNGINPPMPHTDAEKLWAKENRPIPFENV
ncbi:putative oxalocrotonate tautomerase [Umbelopsis sp. PMI_123]|nr:putative oxalocrotonate tautomerase [Umbelopsis sp. PMI_123]